MRTLPPPLNILFFLWLPSTALAFLSPQSSVSSVASATPKTTTTRWGYLDNLSPPEEDDLDADDSKEATDMNKKEIDRYGPGDFSQFVDFAEFDGGDGRT